MTFNEWWMSYTDPGDDGAVWQDRARAAWDYQQVRIDELEAAAQAVVEARGKGVADIAPKHRAWFGHLMNRIDALAALLGKKE